MAKSISEITLNRGCCEIKPGSQVCPPGPDDQYIENDKWTNHVIRCKDDLCNSGKGDGTDSTGNGGANQGVRIIVSGRNRAATSLPTKTAFITIIGIMLFSA